MQIQGPFAILGSAVEGVKERAGLDADFESGDAQKRIVLFTPIHRHNEELPLARSYVYGRMLKDPPFRPYLLAEFWMNVLAEKNRSPSTAEAKKDRIHLLDEGKEEIKNYRIYDCFGYELSFGGNPLCSHHRRLVHSLTTSTTAWHSREA